MSSYVEFDELIFFAEVKKRLGMFLGRKSLISLRDQLFGMIYAFSACGYPDALKFFKAFIEYCNNKLFLTDQNGYVCWWNHILYTSGGMDDLAFDQFYRDFSEYLLKEYNLKLPEVE